jgi:hypothetical protein
MGFSDAAGPQRNGTDAFMERPMKVGIDFDNTIVTYDEVFRSAAARCGLIDGTINPQKRAIRDHIRRLPDGESAWQRLQGYVYGKGIVDARMFDGVDGFLRRCRAESCPVVIVSHKTEFGHHDPERVNLRQSALDWMTARGFFGDGGYGLSRQSVYFEGTRAEKLARISALGCTHFIDDLEEVFADPLFPPDVARILFAARELCGLMPPVAVCPTWRDVEERIFRARN